MNQTHTYRLSLLEKGTLMVIAIMLITGYWLYYTDRDSFFRYVVEDGVVEWLSVLGLLSASVVCFRRFFMLFKNRTWWFLAILFVFAVILFFGAGEEISWGQRLLGLKSSEFFEKNNAQGETNLHNLVVDGVKLNKLIFTLALGVAMIMYLLAVPLLYNKNTGARRLMNSTGVPVPRTYQVIFFVLFAALASLIPHEKNAELLECVTGLMLFLIIAFPRNDLVFRMESKNA